MNFLLRSRTMSGCTRSIHSGQVRFQFVKDVYKMIGYQAPFDTELKHECLRKINDLQEKELWNYTSKKMSKLIYAHKEKNGPFECIEQLLDLPKLEKFQLEKICNNLLEEVPSQTLEEKLEEKRMKVNKPLFSKGLIPKPDILHFSSLENPTIVGVSVALESVGFAKIDQKSLVDWSSLPAVDDPNSKTSYQHINLFSLASEIVSSLPQGDFYLFEEMLPILPKDVYMNQKVDLIKLRTALITILTMSNQNTPVGVYTVKQSVLDSLFQLKVGMTRVKMQDSLDEIISPVDDNPYSVQISDEAWKTFNGYTSMDKEYISGSLLNCIAFNYLCREAQEW